MILLPTRIPRFRHDQWDLQEKINLSLAFHGKLCIIIKYAQVHAGMAQLVEQRIRNA